MKAETILRLKAQVDSTIASMDIMQMHPMTDFEMQQFRENYAPAQFVIGDFVIRDLRKPTSAPPSLLPEEPCPRPR